MKKITEQEPDHHPASRHEQPRHHRGPLPSGKHPVQLRNNPG